MGQAVYFDDEARFHASEVGDVACQRNLLAKLRSLASKFAPKKRFRQRHRLPEFAGAGDVLA